MVLEGLKRYGLASIMWLASLALSMALGPIDRPLFRDVTSELGLSLTTDSACWVDVDNDGWTDLCAAGAVWKNEKGRKFAKIASVGNVVAADFDNDGFADLFSWSQLKLYHNDSGKGFTEVSLPELPSTVSRGACWGDFDGDGFVDLYVGGFEDWDKQITYPDMILMNQKGKGFVLAWQETRFRARGVTACDFDRDADLDVYVSNYRLQPNVLWLNDGTGHFRDATAEFNAIATSPGFEGGHSIGAAWGDFDEDGEFDLFAGNFAHQDDRGDQPKSRFLRNLGKHKGYRFDDLGPCGVFYQESYATPAAGDFDDDGDLDLFFTTVYAPASFNRMNYPVLFRNDGGFKFADATNGSGLEKLPPTYQAAWADFNHDGKLDLVSGGNLFVNQAPEARWIEVGLTGDGRHVNKSAIGAQVRVAVGKRVLTRQVEAGTGEGNQNDLRLHFGLGNYGGKVTLAITWPDGKRHNVFRVRTNRVIDLKYR